MRVLVACECSGTVRRAFRERGHDAWSCDLLPARDGDPHHIHSDVRDVLCERWDLMIAHPDCTYLTNSAAWAYGDGPYHMRLKPETLTGAARRAARAEAVEFVRTLFWTAAIPRICIENPVGHLSRVLAGEARQIVQPYEFGDDASKATVLWLKSLPPLRHTGHVRPRIVNGKPRWSNQTDGGQNRLSPSPDRAAIRAITYPGIAAAMADQWGSL